MERHSTGRRVNDWCYGSRYLAVRHDERKRPLADLCRKELLAVLEGDPGAEHQLESLRDRQRQLQLLHAYASFLPAYRRLG